MTPHKGHIFLLLIAFTTTLCIGFVYIYMYKTVNRAVERSAEASQRILLAETRKTGNKKFIENYKESISDWDLLSNYFVPSDKYVDFIETLEKIGSTTGSESVISSIEDDKLDTAAPGSFGKIRAHVDVKGTWVSVMKALQIAENLPYKASIDNVQVSLSENEKEKKKVWELGFDITAAVMSPMKDGQI